MEKKVQTFINMKTRFYGFLIEYPVFDIQVQIYPSKEIRNFPSWESGERWLKERGFQAQSDIQVSNVGVEGGEI